MPRFKRLKLALSATCALIIAGCSELYCNDFQSVWVSSSPAIGDLLPILFTTGEADSFAVQRSFATKINNVRIFVGQRRGKNRHSSFLVVTRDGYARFDRTGFVMRREWCAEVKAGGNAKAAERKVAQRAGHTASTWAGSKWWASQVSRPSQVPRPQETDEELLVDDVAGEAADKRISSFVVSVEDLFLKALEHEGAQMAQRAHGVVEAPQAIPLLE